MPLESQIKVQINPDVPPTGSDLSIVNAARRSFNTRSEWASEAECPTDEVTGGKIPPYKRLKDKDKRLLEFLARGMTADDFEDFLHSMDNRTPTDLGPEREDVVDKLWQWRNTPTHDTPFNHTFISFEVQAPIFVRAQLVKHEYLIMSEFSRRYITDDITFYIPDVWRKAAKDKKQGSSNEAVNVAYYDRDDGYNDWPTDANSVSLEAYQEMLKLGVAPEMARMVLPQSTMTEWTWSGTLGAFAKMCTLRLHPEAQYEARLVAQQVYDHLKEYYPVGAPALVEGV